MENETVWKRESFLGKIALPEEKIKNSIGISTYKYELEGMRTFKKTKSIILWYFTYCIGSIFNT